MSYSLRIWSSNDQAGTYTDIDHTQIIGLDIDPNRSSNDDPFEVVGRQARITCIKSALTDPLLSLVPYNIPVTTIGDGADIQYCYDYYQNLMQVIDDSNGSPIFTGLAQRLSIEYDLVRNQISVTISDTLYIWITIAKQRVDFDTVMKKPASYIGTLARKPLALLGSPLNQLTVDTSLVLPIVYENLLVNLPELSKNPRLS